MESQHSFLIKHSVLWVRVFWTADRIDSVDLFFPEDDEITDQCPEFLNEFVSYLNGDSPMPVYQLNDSGITDFMRNVYHHLIKVTYGETISYQGLALKCGGSNYARATARAVSKNPFPLIVPCHRVLPKHFSKEHVGGFSISRRKNDKGPVLKKRLLILENPNVFD